VRDRTQGIFLADEKRGQDQRVENEGLNVLGGMRAEEVMTGKCPPNRQEDCGNLGVWEKQR